MHPTHEAEGHSCRCNFTPVMNMHVFEGLGSKCLSRRSLGMSVGVRYHVFCLTFREN